MTNEIIKIVLNFTYNNIFIRMIRLFFLAIFFFNLPLALALGLGLGLGFLLLLIILLPLHIFFPSSNYMSNFLTTDKEKFSNPLLDLLNKSLKKSENNGSTLPQIPQLNSSVLKSKSEQPKYISDFDLKFESFSSYTPTSLLRFLDKIKNYTPSQAEIEEFSLSSSQRYSLNNIKLFLILCGGLIGNSFSSNEMTNSINLINSFSKNFSTLESIYHKLTLTEKKLKYSLLQKLLSQEIPEDVSPEFKDLSRESLSKVNNFFDLSKEILVCLEKILSFIKEKRQNFERVEKINNGKSS